MSELINFDEFFKEDNKIDQSDNFLGLRQCFRLLVIGPSGSGKTNVVFNLILKYQKFDKLIYVAKDIYESKLQGLLTYLNTNSKGKPLKIPKMILINNEDFENEIDINDFDRETHTLMVFDDAISYPQTAQDKIQDIFIRGRKIGISSIYISHRYYNIPNVIRNNITHAIFFRTPSSRDLSSFCKQMSLMLDCDLLKKLILECTKEPFNFILIDLTVNASNFPLHIRKGFNSFLNINPFN